MAHWKSSSSLTGTSSTSTAPTKPAGTQQNDFLLATLELQDDNGSNTVTLPAGWTELFSARSAATNARLVVAWKLAGASEPTNYTFSWGTTAGSAIVLDRFAEIDAASPIRTSATLVDVDTSSTNNSAPSITPTTGDMVVACVGLRSSPTNFAADLTPPTGYRGRSSAFESADPVDLGVRTATKVALSGAATGVVNFTGFAVESHGVQLALRPKTASAAEVVDWTSGNGAPASQPFTVNLPANVQDGQLLVIGISIWDPANDRTLTTPAGWTLIHMQADDPQDNRWYVFAKIASGEGATVSIGASFATNWIAWTTVNVIGMSANLADLVFSFAQDAASDADWNSPSVTPAARDLTLLLGFARNGLFGANSGEASGYTRLALERQLAVDAAQYTGVRDSHLAGATGVVTTPAAGLNAPVWGSQLVIKALVIDPPTNVTPPVASGTAVVGQTLAVTNGTWTGSPTFTYQWLRDGVAIAGATSSTYTLVTADAGRAFRARVTGTNGAGSSSVDSNTILAQSQPPQNLTKPVISGMPQVGQTLRCSTGTWLFNPTRFDFTWERSPNAVTWDDVPGAISQELLLLHLEEKDMFIRCEVLATNPAGTAAALADHVGPATLPTFDAVSRTCLVTTPLNPLDGGVDRASVPTVTTTQAAGFCLEYNREKTFVELINGGTNDAVVLVEAEDRGFGVVQPEDVLVPSSGGRVLAGPFEPNVHNQLQTNEAVYIDVPEANVILRALRLVW